MDRAVQTTPPTSKTANMPRSPLGSPATDMITAVMMMVVTVIPEIGVTEIMAMAQAETVVKRKAMTRANKTEIKVIQVGLGTSLSTTKRKKTAIFRHESQKDSALFPGPDDPREFWQRAEERNRHTADLYNRIGLPEYYAMEAFVRWNPT